MSAKLWSVGVLVLLAAACSEDYGSGSSASCTSSATQVCLRNSAFVPANDTVTAGTTVTWKNADGFNHTVTSSTVPGGGPTFNTNLGAGTSTAVALTVAGTYEYYCTIHGTPTTGMRGRVVVQ